MNIHQLPNKPKQISTLAYLECFRITFKVLVSTYLAKIIKTLYKRILSALNEIYVFLPKYS